MAAITKIITILKNGISKYKSLVFRPRTKINSISKPLPEKIKSIEKIDTHSIQSEVIKLYLFEALKQIKEEYINQYNLELEKHNHYQVSLENKHNNTHIIVLKNMQILQSNIGIINNALSEIETNSDEAKQNIKKQLGCESILDIPLYTKTRYVNIK